jgi:hypothetical protein
MDEQNPNEVILFNDYFTVSRTIFKIPFSDTEKEVQAQSIQSTLNERFKLRLIKQIGWFMN